MGNAQPDAYEAMVTIAPDSLGIIVLTASRHQHWLKAVVARRAGKTTRFAQVDTDPSSFGRDLNQRQPPGPTFFDRRPCLRAARCGNAARVGGAPRMLTVGRALPAIVRGGIAPRVFPLINEMGTVCPIDRSRH